MVMITHCQDCGEPLPLGKLNCRCGWKWKPPEPTAEELRAIEEREARKVIELLGDYYDNSQETIQAFKKEHGDDWLQHFTESLRVKEKQKPPKVSSQEIISQWAEEARQGRPSEWKFEMTEEEERLTREEFIASVEK